MLWPIWFVADIVVSHEYPSSFYLFIQQSIIGHVTKIVYVIGEFCRNYRCIGIIKRWIKCSEPKDERL